MKLGSKMKVIDLQPRRAELFVAVGQSYSGAQSSYPVVIGVFSTEEKARQAQVKWKAESPSWRDVQEIIPTILDERVAP